MLGIPCRKRREGRRGVKERGLGSWMEQRLQTKGMGRGKIDGDRSGENKDRTELGKQTGLRGPEGSLRSGGEKGLQAAGMQQPGGWGPRAGCKATSCR